MPNPFLFGKIVTDKHFCNREKERQLLIDNLMGRQSIVVISPRRLGKSSLLAVVSDKLEKQGMVCGRIDFFALNSIRKILGETVRVCAQMMLNQETNLKRFLSLAADVFKRTRIAIEPTPDGNVSIKPEVGLPADIRTSLSESILGLDHLLEKKNKQGLLVMDEFQEITLIDKDDRSNALEAEFRTMVQSTKQLSFAFLGSHARLLSDMFTARQRPFFQAAKIIQLGPIDRKSLKSFIRRRFLSVGVKVENIKEVLNLVEGHPDYTQRFCSHLYDIVNASGEPPPAIQLNESLLRQGLDAMIDGCELIFIAEWQTFPLRQQQVLSLLAEKGPLRRVSAVNLAEYEMTHTSFNTALKQLIRKGLLREDEYGNYRLADPIFRRWIACRAVG
jgi:AAA+ ATPase superfamily predicted ATPase